MKIKKILNKKLSLKTFIVIQSVSLFFQWILMLSLNGLLFYILPPFISNSFIIKYTLDPLTRLLFGAVFMQGMSLISIVTFYLGDIIIPDLILWLSIIPFILFQYGFFGYLMARFRKNNLNLGYALFSVVIIALFYAIIGLLLTRLGLIQWS